MATVGNIQELRYAALALDRGPVDQRQKKDGDEPAHIGSRHKNIYKDGIVFQRFNFVPLVSRKVNGLGVFVNHFLFAFLADNAASGIAHCYVSERMLMARQAFTLVGMEHCD